MVKIEFLDGDVKEYQAGITLGEIADGISKSLRKRVVAGKVNDEIVELFRPIEEDAKIEFIEIDSLEGEDVINHSAAHLLAHAVTRLFPNAKFGVGPAIEEGFYYDIDAGDTILEEDLKRIEKEMKKIVSEAIPLERIVASKEEALEMFKNDEYKVELISELEDQVITFYKQGDFIDLCRDHYKDE